MEDSTHGAYWLMLGLSAFGAHSEGASSDIWNAGLSAYRWWWETQGCSERGQGEDQSLRTPAIQRSRINSQSGKRSGQETQERMMSCTPRKEWISRREGSAGSDTLGEYRTCPLHVVTWE